MADFTSVTVIRDNLLVANNILNTFQSIYLQSLAVQAMLARYQSDSAFKVQVDHLFTPAQVAELGNMITDINTLQAVWAASHKGPLGL